MSAIGKIQPISPYKYIGFGLRASGFGLRASGFGLRMIFSSDVKKYS
ncbi:MAG: hypothetical protein LC116_06600 [Bacteroidetes bacterium]|nr:hypothetical protein [Bacteroidota bacterium]